MLQSKATARIPLLLGISSLSCHNRGGKTVCTDVKVTALKPVVQNVLLQHSLCKQRYLLTISGYSVLCLLRTDKAHLTFQRTADWQHAVSHPNCLIIDFKMLMSYHADWRCCEGTALMSSRRCGCQLIGLKRFASQI